MLNLLLALTSSLYFPCSDCLAQFKQVKSETLKLQSVLLIANSPCTSGGNVWTNVAKNKWLSDKGIALKIIEKATYQTLPFARFWDTENALEAHTILANLAPGEEINVIKFFRRSANRWLYYKYVDHPECPPKLDCGAPPYVIHYLHRPQNNWVIDLLSSHAEGFITSKYENGQDIYFIAQGPYMPIYEGSFKYKGNTFWFSAREVKPNQNLSTPEMRYEAFQAINELATCITVQT